MKEHVYTYGLEKGLRRFESTPRNSELPKDLHNWEPTEDGLEPREEIKPMIINTLVDESVLALSFHDDIMFGDGVPEIPGDGVTEISSPEITFPCVGAITHNWDYGNSIEVIAPSSSGTITVELGTPPYTWSVTGIGYSLLFSTTEDGINTLITDGTACGSAEITVRDSCNFVIIGYVRSTIGAWAIHSSGTSVITGEFDHFHKGISQDGFLGTRYYVIKDKYKQMTTVVQAFACCLAIFCGGIRYYRACGDIYSMGLLGVNNSGCDSRKSCTERVSDVNLMDNFPYVDNWYREVPALFYICDIEQDDYYPISIDDPSQMSCQGGGICGDFGCQDFEYKCVTCWGNLEIRVCSWECSGGDCDTDYMRGCEHLTGPS